jgi:hypothetical protein
MGNNKLETEKMRMHFVGGSWFMCDTVTPNLLLLTTAQWALKAECFVLIPDFSIINYMIQITYL